MSLEADNSLRAWFDIAPDAILIIGAERKVLDANRKACSLFGYQMAELIGLELDALLPHRYRKNHGASVLQYMIAPRERRMGSGRELWALTKDGREFPVEIALGPRQTVNGVQVMAIVHDMSESRALEQQLREAQRLEVVGRMAGGIAHDFNNLLAIVKMSNALLLEAAQRHPDTTLLCQEIEEACDRGSAVTRQLLAFSKRQIMQPTAIDLNDTVRGVQILLSRLMGERITIDLRLVEAPLPIYADRCQVEQVILNLAVNARDAMPNGGTLRLLTHFSARADETSPSFATLLISDTGEGIPKAIVDHIFEPFFSTKELSRGTGLGLSTVHGIIAQSKGRIFVTSEVGVGTTFTIEFPLYPGICVPQGAGADSSPALKGHQSLMVVVGSEPLRRLMATALREQGYRVTEAGDAAEAEALSREAAGEIQLLIADVGLRDTSGGDLAHRMRSHHPQLKVLFISGYPDDTFLRMGLGQSASEFLAMPFDSGELCRKICMMLGGGAP